MSGVQGFKRRLKKHPYTIGRNHNRQLEYLWQQLDIATLQQINEVIQKQSQLIVQHFTNHTDDLSLIEHRTPLCFESITGYFHSMTRGVYKRHGSHIPTFKKGLETTAAQLNEILNSSTHRLAKHADPILKDGQAKKVLVYSYSKAVALTLKRLAKSLEDSLQVFVCVSGGLQQGVKLYEQLALEGVNCQLINDNQVGYIMGNMTCVLVGAQVILDNGGVLNRAGTSMIAALAHLQRKPFYVLAQSYKFLRKTFLRQSDIPQQWVEGKTKKAKSVIIDLTPPEHITTFCTDNGLYTPEVIAVELSKILK